MVGQASAATVNHMDPRSYELTGRYGVSGNPITAGKAPRDGKAPSYDEDKRPLIGLAGQMLRMGACGSGTTEIVFTDSSCHNIRKLTTEKFIPGQTPENQPHTITTLIGTGEHGDVDGTAIPIIIPGGEKEDSGSESDHEAIPRRHGGGKEDSGSESDHEVSPRRHCGLKEDSGSESDHEHEHGFGHRKHSIDGYVSGEDSDSGIGHCHRSAFQKVVSLHRRGSDGSIHEDDDRVCAEDLVGGLESPHRSRSPSVEHCDKDDRDSESGCIGPIAQFNRPLGIASLPSDRGPQFLVSDIGNEALKVINSFTSRNGVANYLSQTVTKGKPEQPRFITSDGNNKYFCAADDCIVEVNLDQQPPVKVIAGKKEYDFAAAMQVALNIDYDAMIDKLLRDDCSDTGHDAGSDTESDSGEILVTPLNGACGIAHTVESGNPTLHYTERCSGAIGKLVQTGGAGGSWTHSTVLGEGTFTKPTSISATPDGYIVVDTSGVNLVTGDAVHGYKHTKIIDVPNAISAEIGCDGDIYVSCTDSTIKRFSPKKADPVPDPVPVPVLGPGGANAGVIAAAANENARKASTSGDEVGEQDFRFGLSSEQIMLTMRQRGVNFAESSGDPYSKALNALEKAVDSNHAIKQIGKGMTFWVSGLYTQGQLDSMFGNPAMKNKHYAIMVGTHYKDAATQQIFGVAVNVGFGNSIAKTDGDIRTDNKAAQITLYYNKKFDEHWKFSWHNNFMRSMDRHQRPFTDNAGNKQMAIGNGVTYEFASSAEISYKHEFCRDNYLKPFASVNYTLNKEMAWKEKNVSERYAKSYSNASMDQIGLQFGIKSSFGKKISDTKTFVVMPRISYTNFAKMGKASQTSVNIASGQTSIGQSGTPGRHLISATLGIGVVDYESNTTTRFAYTGNVQKQKRSHEFLLDWGMKF